MSSMITEFLAYFNFFLTLPSSSFVIDVHILGRQIACVIFSLHLPLGQAHSVFDCSVQYFMCSDSGHCLGFFTSAQILMHIIVHNS